MVATTRGPSSITKMMPPLRSVAYWIPASTLSRFIVNGAFSACSMQSSANSSPSSALVASRTPGTPACRSKSTLVILLSLWHRPWQLLQMLDGVVAYGHHAVDQYLLAAISITAAELTHDLWVDQRLAARGHDRREVIDLTAIREPLAAAALGAKAAQRWRPQRALPDRILDTHRANRVRDHMPQHLGARIVVAVAEARHHVGRK